MKRNALILILSLVLQILFTGCSSQDLSPTENPSTQKLNQMTVDDPKYSLTEDREKFAELRKDIPQDLKKKNDEKALYLDWMSELKYSPAEIREKFNSMIKQKRERFNTDLQRLRDEFSRNEKNQRQEFSEKLEHQKDLIRSGSYSRDKKAQLYDDLEIKRKDFYSKQKEMRDDFDYEYNIKKKDFEIYIKDRTDIFNLDLNTYTARWNQK